MISFIILNYRSENFLITCIKSIQTMVRDVEYEIIIFNNDTNKINPLFLDDPSIKIIEGQKNLGFARGCNAGTKKASGKYLFFLNPDTEIISDNIQLLRNLLDTDKAIGIASPEVISSDGLIEKWSYGKEANIISLIKENLFPKKETPSDSEVVETDWVSGCAMMIRRELFEKIRGFDENFFMYFEDMDLCKRIRREGLKVVRVLPFKIKHFGGKSFSNKKTQKDIYYSSQNKYFLKHHGRFKTALLKFFRIFHGK